MIPETKGNCVVDVSMGTVHYKISCSAHLALLWFSVMVSVSKRHFFDGKRRWGEESLTGKGDQGKSHRPGTSGKQEGAKQCEWPAGSEGYVV